MLTKKGQSLVELLIVFALASSILPAVLTGAISSRDGRAQLQQRQAAFLILKQAEEATRSYRQIGWVNFAIDGTFHPQLVGNSWNLSSGPGQIAGFEVTVVISPVVRDDIDDPSTKKVVTTVSWNSPRQSSITSTKYLTRYQDNIAHKETTKSNFDAGTKFQTAVSLSGGSLFDDGQVQLGAGSQRDWCDPNLSITALDLPKSGVANAISAIPGQAFAGTGNNASGISFANVSITTPPSGTAPSADLVGTFDGHKTNAVFGEAQYAYLGTDTNTKEIVIVDLRTKDANNKYSEAGYFNAPGNGNGDTIFVSGNTGYMTSGNKLYKFALSANRSGSQGSPTGTANLEASAKKLIVVGSYAYLAINSDSKQLQIVDLNTMSVVGWAHVNNKTGRDLYVSQSDDSKVYLVTAEDTGTDKPEFFIIDTGGKGGERPVLSGKTYNTYQSGDPQGMDPKAVTIVTGNKAILVGHGGYEYQVVKLDNMQRCGQLNIDTGINGSVSIIDTQSRAYTYIITGDVSSEFKIIEGGPGGGAATSGTFESQTSDPCVNYSLCHQTAFNHLSANVYQPEGTFLKLQVAVAMPVNNSCAGVNFTFMGSDPANRTGSYFSTASNGDTTINGAVPMISGRCFRYKAFFSTGNPEATPVLKDFTVNFSP
ncbi:MAG: type II secretion system protein [Patescibacteria group bacterium]